MSEDVMTPQTLLKEYLAGRRDFRGVDLASADLAGANLAYAYLVGANLASANLTGADLAGADFSLGGLIDSIDLRRRVAEQIEQHPATHAQSLWHSDCGTKHCVAGWTVILAGPIGTYLERQWGTATAADVLLGGKIRPSFDPSAQRDEILAALRGETT